jgi:MFS family permease
MTAIGFPCYQAMLPDLVEHDELLAAVSLSTAQFNLGRVIGPALAGVVIAIGGYSWAFVLNAVSFGAVLAALTMVRVPKPEPGDDLGIWQRIADGARVARREPGAWSALGLATVMALCLSPFISLVPAMAVVVHGGGSATTATFVTAQGVGAVVGAIAMPSLAAHHGRRAVLLVSFALLPTALIAYAAAPNVALATVAIGAVGLTYIGVFSGLNVVLQLRAPEGYRARLLSLYFVVVGVLYPLGAAVQGRVADSVGLRQVTAGGAVVWIVVVGALAVVRPQRFAHLGDREEPIDDP